jgi:hypothetical protein
MKTLKQKNETASVVNLTRIQIRIQIQLFTSMRIRIKGAKSMRSMRIRILVRFCHHKKLYFTFYILHFTFLLYVRKTYLRNTVRRHNSLSERLQFRFILFWSISLLLDPDPHSQYGSGSPYQGGSAQKIRKKYLA